MGAMGSVSLEDMISKLSGRKIVWMMVPSGGWLQFLGKYHRSQKSGNIC